MPDKNIILITSDQFRWDALGCAGNTFIKTPNLDKLAKSGVIFTNAMSSNPICIPARATMTTGNHAHKCTGNKNNSGEIKEDQLKIAEYFNKFGYETYKIGKFHYVPYRKNRLVHGFKYWEMTESGRILQMEEETGNDLGGEDYHKYLKEVGYENMTRAHGIGNNEPKGSISPVPLEHYVDSWVLKRTLHYLGKHQENTPNKPFFVWMSFPKPHSPYDPPEPYHKMYDPRKIPPPTGKSDMLNDRNPELKFRLNNYALDYLSKEAVQLSRARYYGVVSLQDRLIGELLKYLKVNGLKDSTSLLFTADHGDLLGDFGIFFKSCFLNGSVRVPFIVSSPSLKKKGIKDTRLAGLEDVFPTLCDLAGLPVPQNIDGKTIVDPKAQLRDVYISQCHQPPNQKYMAFDGRFKYCYAECGGVEELYDLKKDPDELQNLSKNKTHTNKLSKLRNYVIGWCKKNNDCYMLDKKGKLRKSKIDIKTLRKNPVDILGWNKH